MRGIRRHGRGWQAWVTAGTGRDRLYACRSFPLATAEDEMQAWRATERVRLRQQRHVGTPERGTLADDARRYLAAVSAMPTYAERERHITLWVAALGGWRRRDSLTPVEIATVLDGWRSDGLAPQTLRLRLNALRHLWRVLDGPDMPNPARRVPLPRPPQSEPRALPVETVRALLTSMRPSQARARLALLAATGIPYAQMAQITAAQVAAALETGVLTVARRRKGAGAPSRQLPLSPDMRAALEEFARWRCYGPFSASSIYKVFRRAVKRLGWEQQDMRPYDLRHTLGTEAYRATADLPSVARLLGHAKTATAARYAQAALAAVDAATVAQLPGVLPAGLESQPKAKLRRVK